MIGAFLKGGGGGGGGVWEFSLFFKTGDFGVGGGGGGWGGGGGGGRGGCRNFPFYLKPVILRRMPEKIFLKLTSKIWFMRKLAYVAIYL